LAQRPPIHRPAHREGRSREASRAYDRTRVDDHRFYNSTAWLKLRAVQLREFPLCVDCLAIDRVTAATNVDHVLPRKKRPDLELDQKNLQSLCHPHHSAKTRRETGGGVDRDGTTCLPT
jgi:5-methylcytosine-specific restriction protein A